MDLISNTHDRSLQKPPVGLLDAFGRLRTSGPFTLFDSQNRYGISNKFYSNVSGSGSVTFLSSESSVLLSLTGTGSIVRESKNVFSYQPGKSLLILNSFVMSSSNTCTQRVGYFNDSNGVFLERAADGVLSFVVRNEGVETKVNQSAWNTNKCPGLNLTKAQIFWMDIEWLGVGTVRTGFVIDGVFVTAHAFHHANRVNGVYMKTAILPVRYEISGDSPGSMKQICSSVISEGGYDQKLPLYSQIRGTTSASTVNLAIAGVVYPLISIRLAASRFDSIVNLKFLDIVTTTNDLITWYLYLSPTLTNSNWTAHANSTNVEVDVSASAIAGGSVIFSGYLAQKGTIQVPTNEIDFSLGRTNVASDVITLAASGFNNNLNIGGMISWIEI